MTSWCPRSVIRKGTLYWRRPSMRRCTRSIDTIGFPIRPSYPLTGTGFSRFSIGVFKNSEIFQAHLVSRRAKALALESAKAVVLTPHPLRDKLHRIVKLFPPINRLRSTSDISIAFDPEEESSFRVLLFPTL